MAASSNMGPTRTRRIPKARSASREFAVRRASSQRITAVLPYFGYSRQDRRPRSARVPLTAKLVADMIITAGADRVLTVDLHADQVQGFFDKPVDNIYASPILLGDIWRQEHPNLMVVSPDVGGVVRARALAAAQGRGPDDHDADASPPTPSQRERRKHWARLIAKVLEVDPLRCSCGATMRIVAVIVDPLVIRKILDHLARPEARAYAPPAAG